ncbi:DgyrCDS12103 [Dimorphilus gyrociliatus]|uniref:Phospholipase B-like n=1 Tax=Dimorphilus gyrociliatus TaxID=2664684 RepID=A0A7I8W6Q5_9ANNE|nr:DgyrCDS12103 [Dimorphilus gyrociliatus]
MFAAGYLEGILTAKSMADAYRNVWPYFFKGFPEVEKKTKEFLNKQEKWIRKQISVASGFDEYWRHVQNIFAQYDGLQAGYQKVAETDKSLPNDYFVVQMLNAAGDLIDISHAVAPKTRIDINKMKYEEFMEYVNGRGMCSALIKLLPGFENIFMSHSSWFTYSNSYRIYKHYDFNLSGKNVASKSLSFSSYPGYLESLDDFYIMQNGLVMLQTTNMVFNTTIYDKVSEKSLLAWHRVRLANMLAHNGLEWSKMYAKYNSGTYNNQYMVIDLNRIKLKTGVEDGALYVIEQLPGIVKYADQTDILRAGYWPSYNVPFYEDIYEKSGYSLAVKKFGINFSYQLAPRAKIFRRDQGSVKTFDDMKRIMRYNNYKVDEYSDGNPCNTICCRGDLNAKKPESKGCYDTKITDYSSALSRRSIAISGPTLGTNLKPFSWTGIFEKEAHFGLPTTYNFDWVEMKPKLTV